jgi:hypothetical protein
MAILSFVYERQTALSDATSNPKCFFVSATAAMQLKLGIIFCLLGSVISAPSSYQTSPLSEPDQRLVKQAWEALGQTYKHLEQAVSTINPVLIMDAIERSSIPQAHQEIMNMMRDTENAVRGLPMLSALEALGLIGPAQVLQQAEVAALNALVRASPIISSTIDRNRVRSMLSDQLFAHVRWSDTFNALIPNNGQKQFGQSITKQVHDTYQSTINTFQFG